MLGKLSVVGPNGVSCIIVSNGFSKTGNSARFKFKLENCDSKLEITSPATSIGFLCPIFAALSDSAERTSEDKEYGVKKF